MTEDRAIPDAAQVVALAEAASTLTSCALNALGDTVPEGLRHGHQLYMTIQLLPQFAVLLMYDAAPGDPDNKPVELARWTGEVAMAVRRSMMN